MNLEVNKDLERFLDARSYEEKLQILCSIEKVDDLMINSMAASLDIQIREGLIEERKAELKKSLMMMEKFECSRLRG